MGKTRKQRAGMLGCLGRVCSRKKKTNEAPAAPPENALFAALRQTTRRRRASNGSGISLVTPEILASHKAAEEANRAALYSKELKLLQAEVNARKAEANARNRRRKNPELAGWLNWFYKGKANQEDTTKKDAETLYRLVKKVLDSHNASRHGIKTVEDAILKIQTGDPDEHFNSGYDDEKSAVHRVLMHPFEYVDFDYENKKIKPFLQSREFLDAANIYKELQENKVKRRKEHPGLYAPNDL